MRFKFLKEKNKKVYSWKKTLISMLVFVGAVNKLHDIEERTRRTEDSSKENKSALGESFLLLDTSDCPVASAQLISHTKNVERAVTLSQQDMVAKKEQQGSKIQEINHKLASVQQVSGQWAIMSHHLNLFEDKQNALMSSHSVT